MEQNWTAVIKPKNRLLDLQLKELWRYRDLIIMFVKRDFKAMYKQTVLGPLWIIINPLLTTLIQMIVFGNIAGLSTNGTPQFVFYLSGNAVWLYFSGSFSKTANTFVNNAAVFGKVYFPRLVMPISVTISNFGGFDIFLFFKGASIPELLYASFAIIIIGNSFAFYGMRNNYFCNDHEISGFEYFSNIWYTIVDVWKCGYFSRIITSRQVDTYYYVKSRSSYY